MNPSFGLWPLSSSPPKIRVLYVDHDSTCDVDQLRDIFTLVSCEVTMVKLDSTALELLSNGNPKFDIVMENIHSAYSNGFRLLHDATKMDTPVIMLTDNDDPTITMRGLKEGAIFCFRKPITLEDTRYIWQHVSREKIRKARENERLKYLMTNELQRNGNNSGLHDHTYFHPLMKSCTERTPELHANSVDFVGHLKKGRCLSNERLERMSMSDLTRMQATSYIQQQEFNVPGIEKVTVGIRNDDSSQENTIMHGECFNGRFGNNHEIEVKELYMHDESVMVDGHVATITNTSSNGGINWNAPL